MPGAQAFLNRVQHCALPRAVYATIIALVLSCQAASAQEEYGAKGIYPVYESSGQWIIFEKNPSPRRKSQLRPGHRFLVIGSAGSDLFIVARSSMAYGGACKDKRPVKLNAALLRGERASVGVPIIGIHVPPEFSLKGSRARYKILKNQVAEETYKTLDAALKQSVISEIKSGSFPFRLEDEPTPEFLRDPAPARVGVKMDFGSGLELAGLSNPFVLVEGTQVFGTYRRCLRLSDGARLVGNCVEMPHVLMAETSLLEFVSYDPKGAGLPYLLAYTTGRPLWGHERWGFVIRNSGPKLFLMDSMDHRCREAF